MQRPGQMRERWVIAVTLAETIGYLAPAVTGIFVTRAGWPGDERAIALTAAGLVEGLALGSGQAWAFPLRLRRLRFALLTAVGAGLVWATVMSMMLLASGPSLPLPLAVGLGVLAALLGLGAIGSAQWLELRHHTPRAGTWIAWTALAWSLALPLSFAPGPLVDASTPPMTQVVLWSGGGLLMALVMALVTWQGVRRLLPMPNPVEPTEATT
jgi:hypothetical protein